MDLEVEIASLKNRMAIVEAELNQVQAKLDRLVEAKKILTEVMMTLVAESKTP
jgi:hypothetical protein